MIYDFIDWCKTHGHPWGFLIYMCTAITVLFAAILLLSLLVLFTKGWVLLVLLIVPVLAIYGLVKYFVDKKE